MARLKEDTSSDSEEEFPNLTKVLQQYKLSTQKPQNGRCSGSSRKDMIATSRETAMSTARKASQMDGDTKAKLEKSRHVSEVSAKPKIKKRVVLANRLDNSLLRPFEELTRPSVRSISLGGSTQSATKEEARISLLSDLRAPEAAVEASDRRVQLRTTSRIAKQKMALVREKEVPSEDSGSSSDSGSMSDFIVHDSSAIEEEDEDQEDSAFSSPPRPPKSARRLVRGRRPDRIRADSEDEELASTLSSQLTNTKEMTTLSEDESGKSGLEQSLAILSFSPSEAIFRKPTKAPARFRTPSPPASPTKSKSRLISPSKKTLRLPPSHHRQSTDEEFWKAEVISDFIDEYSPVKPLRTLSPAKQLIDRSPRKQQQQQEKPDTSIGTGSSPTKRTKSELAARKSFQAEKYDLAISFLQELDGKMTENRISEMCASTGGIKITWSKTLQTTAGRANWKRTAINPTSTRPTTSSAITINTETCLPPLPKQTHHHHATIELSSKVIDTQDRLLNVLAHEYCHLANFIITAKTTNPHGREFQAWGGKCSELFAHRGVVVTTKHSYTIEYKYVWICSAESCGVEYGRQSKSLDPARHACGACKGKLVQVKPTPRGGAAVAGAGAGAEQGDGKNGANKQALSVYQAFVKENMAVVRRENAGVSHREIMGLVAKRYRAFKATAAAAAAACVDTGTVGAVGAAKDDDFEEAVDNRTEQDSIPKEVQEYRHISTVDLDIDGGLDFVSRKLDFMDLTSP